MFLSGIIPWVLFFVSFLVLVWFYSPVFGLLLFVTLIWHEYGHFYAASRLRLETKGMYLIPFLGGAVVSSAPDSQWYRFILSIFGPLFGLAMSALSFVVWLVTGSEVMGNLAVISTALNIFQLLPVYPLDGGHVVKALVFSYGRSWLICVSLAHMLVITLLLSMWLESYFLEFLLGFGVVGMFNEWRHPDNYPAASPMDIGQMKFALFLYCVMILLFCFLVFLLRFCGVPVLAP